MHDFIFLLLMLKYASYNPVNASVFTEEVFDVFPKVRILYDYVTDVLLEKSRYGCAAICHGITYCSGASYNSRFGICEISTTSYTGNRENDSDWTVIVPTGGIFTLYPISVRVSACLSVCPSHDLSKSFRTSPLVLERLIFFIFFFLVLVSFIVIIMRWVNATLS